MVSTLDIHFGRKYWQSKGLKLGVQWTSVYMTIQGAIDSTSASWIDLPTQRPEHPRYLVGLLMKKSVKCTMYNKFWGTPLPHHMTDSFIIEPDSLPNGNFCSGISFGKEWQCPTMCYLSEDHPVPTGRGMPFSLWWFFPTQLCSHLLGTLSSVILTVPYCAG